MSLLTKVRVDIAVGFGLFAILSIIRLRSSAVTQQEVAYYFLALVLGWSTVWVCRTAGWSWR
jgi:hypothetical protein